MRKGSNEWVYTDVSVLNITHYTLKNDLHGHFYHIINHGKVKSVKAAKSFKESNQQCQTERPRSTNQEWASKGGFDRVLVILFLSWSFVS